MKFNPIKIKGLILTVLILLSNIVFSKQLTPIVNSIAVVAGNLGAAIEDYDKLTLPTGGGAYMTNNVRNYVKLAVNHNYTTLVTNTYKYNVELEISVKDINWGTTVTYTKFLFVEYNPAAGVAYKDYASYNFSNAHSLQVKVVQIRDAVTNAVIGTPEQNLVVTYGIQIERFWIFNYSTIVCPTSTATDLNGDGEMDEMTINWTPITGAEEYELEWTYVDDYSNGAVASTTPISSILYDFKYNSTRISTKNLSYKLNLIYERGYVIYRVRAVGRKLSNIDIVVNGAWSKPDNATNPSASPCTASYYYTAGHKDKFNWQYSSTYAEEGKKKEVVGYYDGSLRNRQTVTKVNTTDTAIVGESIYDFQGRKAIDVLPVPAQSPALTYYPNFNLNLDLIPLKYSRDDFDKDNPSQNCSINATGMSPTAGSSRYYSPNNTQSAYQQSYLPDAFNYPFNQVEYTPDNTGRIRSMGGVGLTHQLGGGKETKYYYGRPLQEELDRLFGSEVGYDRHYKKNVVIDPNGQVSISYLDQEGHVIATALSGNSPGSVSAIPSEASASASLTADLFSKNPDGSSYLNTKNIDETIITFNTQYLVSTPGLTHTFNYNLVPEQYTNACLPSICMDCVYDLQVQIRNECGILIYTNTVRVGSLTLDSLCSGIVYVPAAGNSAPAAFNVTNMPLGNYQISKVLTVNKNAYDYYLTQYLDANKNICFKSYATMLIEEQTKVASILCEDDCASCIASLGTSDYFVLTGKGTYEEWLLAYNNCQDKCKAPSICQQVYETMLLDVKPGGQYAEWYDSSSLAGFNASIFPLSILNFNNQLPDGGLASTNPLAAYWKNPKFLKNDGTTVDGYYERDGIKRSKIPVIPLQGGGYLPAIDVGVTPTNILGVLYVNPENLLDVKDFVTYWQESWSRSLVLYHPEFCYYKWCALNTIDTSGVATLSSEDFDGSILGNDIYSVALSNGWINGSNQYALMDQDPYFNYVPDGIAQVLKMKSQIDDYLGGAPSMKDVAAQTIMCPGFFDNSVGLPAPCTNFGGGTGSQNDAMWKQYRSFYYSAKQKLLKEAADNYAILTSGSNCGKGYNGCIGKDNFNPFQSAFIRHWITNPFADLYTPCGRYNFALYKDKVIRFSLGEDILSGDADNSGFNVYYRTGLCPAAIDFSNWLHTVAASGTLLATGTSLYSQTGFTKLLFDQISAASGSPSPGLVDYHWIPTIGGSDPTQLEISFKNTANTNTLSCKLNLKLPVSLLPYTWSMVKDFTNIKIGIYNPVSGLTGFYLNAMLDDDGLPGTPNIMVRVTGTSCIRLDDCQFYDQCKTSDFGNRLIVLMSALANHTTSDLTSTAKVYLETSYPDYLNRYIRNNFSSTYSSHLIWQCPNPAVANFSLYDDLNSSAVLNVAFTSYSPSFSGSLSNFKYFTNLETDPANVSSGFYMTGWYETSPGVTPLIPYKIRGNISTGTVADGVMARCSEPLPIDCQTKENQASLDLEVLLKKWLATPQTYTTKSLTGDLDYTDLLESYIGEGDHTNLENIVANKRGYYADLNVYNASSVLNNTCHLQLYHIDSLVDPITKLSTPNNFADIVSVEQLIADNTMQTSNKTYNFKMLAIYSTGKKEIIGGYTTCIPIRTCSCEVPKINLNEGSDGSGCTDIEKEVIDEITRYNNDERGSNPNRFKIAQLGEAGGYGSFCGCLGGYVDYLKYYTLTDTPAMAYNNYLIYYCDGYIAPCPEYSLYLKEITEFNTNHPNDKIPVEPYTESFQCNCVKEYLKYLLMFKVPVMSSLPPPAPLLSTGPITVLPAKTFTEFNAASYPGCGNVEAYIHCGSEDTLGSYNIYRMLYNTIYTYNHQIPAPSTTLSMPPYLVADKCCYMKYILYLTHYAGSNTYPNPPKQFSQFKAPPYNCTDIDCYEKYVSAQGAFFEGWVNAGNPATPLPQFEAYDPANCACYLKYINYALTSNGPGMMTVSEFCTYGSMGMSMMSSESYYSEGGVGVTTRNYATRGFCKLDTFPTLLVELTDPCEIFKANQAIYNAKKRYDDQIRTFTTDFRQAYYAKCLSLVENFTATVPIKDYHYTLYYYDQAGSLVATVPPEGVKIIDLAATLNSVTNGARIKSDRANKIKTLWNNHYLKTTYEYNSLNQLKRQSVPDNDKIDVWEVDNSNGVPAGVTITDIQFTDGNIGFSTGKDASGYGYIFKTIDGGVNWKRVDTKTSDVNKVQMIDASNGYAVGNDGLFLQTTDGGINWKIIYVAPSGSIVYNHFNDLYFKDASNGVLAGDINTVTSNSNLIKCVLASGIWTFTNVNTGVPSTFNVLSITPEPSSNIKMYITVSNVAATDNRIYSIPNVWAASPTWTDMAVATKLRATDLKSVSMCNASNGYAAGIDGMLLKTADGGTTWTHIATNTTVGFNKIFFPTVTSGLYATGIAIGNDGVIYLTTNSGNTWAKASAIGTYNDFSFYDQTSTAKGYAVGNSGLLSYIDFANISTNKLVKKFINVSSLNDNFVGVSAVAFHQLYIAANTTIGTPLSKLYVPTIDINDIKVTYGSVSTYSGTGFLAGIQFVSNTKGAVLSTTGKVYNCTLTGSIYTFADISHIGSAYASISTDGSGLYAMHVSGSNTEIYKTITGTWATLGIHGTTLTGETGYNISQSNGKLFVAGNSGLISSINYPTSSAWANTSSFTAPLKLRDVYATTTANIVYAVGDDGTVIKTLNGTDWQTLLAGTAAQLNACYFTSTTDGVIVGNNGTALLCSGAGIAVQNSGTTKHLNHLVYANSKYSSVGQSRTLLESTTGSTYTSVAIPGISTETLKGIGAFSSTFVVFGQNGYSITNTASSWYYSYKQSYSLVGLNINKRNNYGSVVGEKGTSLYTMDRGYTWNYNKPNVATITLLPTYTAVAVWNSTNIYVTGLNNYNKKFTNMQFSTGSTMYSAAGTNWNDVKISEDGKGYLAGSNNKYVRFTATVAGYTAGTNVGLPAAYVVNSISINYDEAFFACDAKKFFKVNVYTNAVTDLTASLPASISGSANLLKYVAYDKRN
ncbi:MAG: YCF48-related protein, partial [bacterium]|nr:YCF48-related protein [bacterium]